jgi:Ca-activated chloride channel family protein
MKSWHWAEPWAFLLLIGVALLLWALTFSARRLPRLRFPPAALLRRSGTGPLARLVWLPGALLAASLALATLALARPQLRGGKNSNAEVEGIDIVIALDISTSMKAADFRPNNRLHVAKEVLKEFIASRQNDRIGLVIFAGDAYTQAPLTLDYGILRGLVDQLRFGVIEDGTAIGNAVATSVNRLRESSAKSKVVVLITDGDNNAGQISPLEAAQIARGEGIKVFTILVGRGGMVPFPAEIDPFGRTRYQNVEIRINPALLQEIARSTGATHYSATDRETLASGLGDILDRLEKSRLFEAGASTRVTEAYRTFLWPAFGLAAFSLLLAATRLRPFP